MGQTLCQLHDQLFFTLLICFIIALYNSIFNAVAKQQLRQISRVLGAARLLYNLLKQLPLRFQYHAEISHSLCVFYIYILISKPLFQSFGYLLHYSLLPPM